MENAKGVGEVALEVVRIFEAEAESDESLSNAHGSFLIFGERGVTSGAGLGDHGSDAGHARAATEQREGVAEELIALAQFVSDFNKEDTAVAGELSAIDFRSVYRLNAGERLKKFMHLGGDPFVFTHAQAECLHAAANEPGAMGSENHSAVESFG